MSALTEARLLVTGQGEGGKPTVEVAHEALFLSWPRLERWIVETADDLRLRRQVTQLADYWEKHGRKDKHRWPDVRAAEAVGMLDHLGLEPEELPASERDFLGPLGVERMLAQIEDPATSHERRASIGVRLALLGDPRPGVGLRADGLPDVVWCEVPGGEITVEVEEQSSPKTFPVEPFRIAKYPVSYVQYRAFLDAEDGFKNPDWWKGFAYQQPDKPGRQDNRHDNHPAENIAWVEAVAFCRWLTTRLGYEIRLPTEWEWQQAATGGNPTRNYPWGPEWDGSCSNTEENELRHSTAVGMYPAGASPVGAVDMSGNLWEWCLNEYDNPANKKVGGTANRVLRGGSFGGCRYGVRCSFRYRSHPSARNSSIGFRVVTSPF